MTDYARSADGTGIAYDRQGSGPGVILVGGAMQFRGFDPTTVRMAGLLAEQGFTVINYDRRGRGETEGTPPITLAQTIDDLGALADLVDGDVALFGNSSGGSISLAAAAAGLPVSAIAVFEVPLDEENGTDGAEFLRDLRAKISAEDGEGTVEHFMKDMPREFLEGARNSPGWPVMVSMGPSLEPDAESLAWTQSAPRAELWASITQPVLVLVAAETLPFMQAAADSMLASLPHARRSVVGAGNHSWEPEEMANAIAAFLSQGAG